MGNLLTSGTSGATTSYTYNAGDELTSSTTGSTTNTYTYDANGNYTGDGTATNSITYNANNQPSSATQGTNTYTFTYDAQGDRVETTKNGSTLTNATWDVNNPQPHIATVTDGSGTPVADYSYDPLGDPQSETTAGGTFYDTHDWLGSVTDLTSAAGVDELQNTYTATGAESTTTQGASPPPDQFGYAGQYNDPVLPGLVDMGARQYDPVTGAFTSPDPVTQPAADPYTSPYAYASDDPTTLTDPTGRTPQTPVGTGVPSGHYIEADRGGARHNFAVGMAYDQLAAKYGAPHVYADLGAAFYGPIGGLLQLPGAGRTGGNGEPDLVVKDEPLLNEGPYAETTKWLMYEVKPASQAGETGIERDGIEYSGYNSVRQLATYIAEMQKLHPHDEVEAGPPIMPESAFFSPNEIETIFSANQWATYGAAFGERADIPMDGLIFYTNFRLTRSRQPSKSFPKALPRSGCCCRTRAAT